VIENNARDVIRFGLRVLVHYHCLGFTHNLRKLLTLILLGFWLLWWQSHDFLFQHGANFHRLLGRNHNCFLLLVLIEPTAFEPRLLQTIFVLDEPETMLLTRKLLQV